MEHFSDKWITILDDALQNNKNLKTIPRSKLLVEYRVKTSPTTYWYIDINQKSIRAQPGPATKPDVWFEADPVAANAMLDGNLDPLQAILDGVLTIGGDPNQLLENNRIIDEISSIFSSLQISKISS